MLINVDTDRCVASGQCVMLAPNIFDQDDDGLVILLQPSPDAADVDAAHQAMRVCPAMAITDLAAVSGAG